MSELDRYDYELPKELIAQHPPVRRTDARLMLVDRSREEISHFHIRDLPELLRPDDGLVLNDSRVILAQLVGRRTTTGGRWLGLFLDHDGAGNWKLLCKTRGKLNEGDDIQLLDREAQPAGRLRLVSKGEGGAWIARPEAEGDPYAMLDRIGRVPLPHYIRHGHMVDDDLQRYQTVYAQKPGSVAAPTAGLHFSPELLQRLGRRGLEIARVTLHVGIGTFRPVTAERLDEHVMHAERGAIDEKTAAQLQTIRGRNGRIVAVGTTTVRLLESAAKGAGPLQPWSGETNLFIRPPYSFQAVDALLTNFHLPRSTLLILVRTFGGDQLIRRAYAEAIKEEYRFFSYGDAMLIV